MTKREREEYRGYASLLGYDTETIAAGQLVRFANLDITPERWAEVGASGYGDYEPADAEDAQPLTDLTWLLFDGAAHGGRRRRTVPTGPKGRHELRRLQRELRTVLDALVRGDAAKVERFVNAAGAFRCRVQAPTPVAKRGAGTHARDHTGGWQLVWEPARTGGARAVLIDAVIGDVLPYADRLGLCELCTKFFVRSSRWATRPRRFCSDACSVTFHNRRRIAENYYTTEARAARARKRARAERAES